MNTKKIIKYILIAIPLLYLAQCGYYKFESTKSPEINPNPKEKMRIYGKFPLDQSEYYIKASVRYIATNQKCDNVFLIAGTRFAQDKSVELNATMSDNHYELGIYNDYYQHGACDWQIGEIDIETIQKDTNKLNYAVGFSTKKSGTYAFKYKIDLVKAKSQLNFICDYEYDAPSDYTHYFCEDLAQNDIGFVSGITIDFYKPIFFLDSQKQLEVNFQQMAEPMKKTK